MIWFNIDVELWENDILLNLGKLRPSFHVFEKAKKVKFAKNFLNFGHFLENKDTGSVKWKWIFAIPYQ